MNFLDSKLRLAPHLTATMIPEEDVAILLEQNSARPVSDPIILSILPLLERGFTGRQLLKDLSSEFDVFASTQKILDLLESQTLVLDSLEGDARQQAFWTANRLPPYEVSSQRTIRLTAMGEPEPNLIANLKALLAAHALTLSSGLDKQALQLVLVDDYLDPELDDICRHAGPIFLASLEGPRCYLGPIIELGETACLSCLQHRWRRNRELFEVARQNISDKPLRPVCPASSSSGLGLLVTQIASWYQQNDKHALKNQIWLFDTVAGVIEKHRITRRPQCLQCGTEGLPEPGALLLEKRPFSQETESGHRLASAEKFLTDYEHLVSPITGIAPALRPLTHDGITHVVNSGHHCAIPATTYFTALDNLRNNACGKGVTSKQARASALAEALERHCSRWDGSEYFIEACFSDIQDRALHPNRVMLFSEKQFEQRDLYNRHARQKVTSVVPRPFDPEATIKWVKAWSLTGERAVWIPASLGYYGFPESLGTVSAIGDSNGNAAGTCLEDAVLQGLLEVVERDAVALWWFNRVPRPEINLEGIHDEYIEKLRERYLQLGREFWVLDLTTDLGIPCCVAMSRQTQGPDLISWGFGAHLDPQICVLRALTEMNQSLPWVLANAERSDRRVPDGTNSQVLVNQRVDECPYLVPDRSQQSKELKSLSFPRFHDLLREVDWCRGKLESKGMEVLVLDLTRPDIELPVVKVLVPGMRPFWRRLAPGRLYDVPVEMGWSSSAKSEEQMNPVDIS